MSNSFVEVHTWSEPNTWFIGGTNPITVSAFTSLAENDLLIAYGRQGVAADVTDLVANGWEIWNKNTASGQAHFVAFQYAGVTPASSYQFTTDTSTSSNDGFVTVIAYRGVKITDLDPLDTPFVLADHYLSSSLASSHTPPDITTNTVDAWLLSIILTNVSSGGPATLSQAGHTIREDAGQDNGPSGGVSDKQEPTPGIVSPADWILTGASSTALMYTLALQSADAVSAEIPNISWEPATGKNYVVYEGDLIPESSCLMFHRGTHTGTNGDLTYTDSTLSLFGDQIKGYRIYNYTDDSEGILATHGPGAGPLTLSEALAGGFDNDFDTGDKVDITIPVEVGDEIVYDAETNLGGTVAMTNVGSFVITGIQGLHTFNIKIRDATDNKVSAPFLVTSSVV